MKRYIYMDYAATTPIKDEVLVEMMPYFTGKYGNPSSIYSLARESRNAVERARERVAAALGAQPGEIYFTSSGTEADNWAIKGIAYANNHKGNHIITTEIEHHAVLHTCNYLEKHGFEITYLPVDNDGILSIEDLKQAIRPNTILISIMFANNEIGTIQPISEIGKIARNKGILFHTDAVQAIGNIHINVVDMNIDLLSLSAHKFYGPKGAGSLYVRKGVKIEPLLHGGSQERGLRASTENVPGIVGLGKAIEFANNNIDRYNKKLIILRDKLIDGVIERIPYIKLNGHRTNRLPGNINFSFRFIEGESLLLLLDKQGIAASSGSACTSGSLDPSHVLMAIGLEPEIAHGSLRLTLGEQNTIGDIEYLLNVLPNIVQKLRDMSPLYDNYKKVDK